MPLSQLSLSLSSTFAFSKANNGFGNTNTAPSTVSFALSSPDLATWNQDYANVFTLFAAAPSGLAVGLSSGGTLTVGQQYFYKVTAVGFNGFAATVETSGSNETSITPTAGNQTASLSWTTLPGAVSYNVYRGTTTGGEDVLIANVTTRTYTDAGGAGTSQSPPGAMPADFVEFDVSSFTNLANEAATAGHVLGLLVTSSGTLGSSQCTLAPGTTNGLTWFFGGTTPTIAIPINGAMALCGPSNSTGQVIDSTHKTLRITNAGSAATTVTISLILGK